MRQAREAGRRFRRSARALAARLEVGRRYSILPHCRADRRDAGGAYARVAAVSRRPSCISRRSISAGETLGRRIARIRKDRGYTQIEPAEKIGIIQSIVSAAERGPKHAKPQRGRMSSRKVLRRLEKIETLPAHQQNALLKSIDLMLKGIAS